MLSCAAFAGGSAGELQELDLDSKLQGKAACFSPSVRAPWDLHALVKKRPLTSRLVPSSQGAMARLLT